MIEYCRHLVKEIKNNFPIDQRKCILFLDTYKVFQDLRIIKFLNENDIVVVEIPVRRTGLL